MSISTEGAKYGNRIEKFCQPVIIDAEEQTRTRFSLAIIYNDVLVGTGELSIRDLTNKVGEVSYIINPDYWNKGIATEATTMLIDFGFNQHQLHRIFVTCDPRNIGSLKVLEKVGMILGGKNSGKFVH